MPRNSAISIPAYAADIAGETRKALDALRTDPAHRDRYDRFVAAMVYGERPEFDAAMTTVVELAEAGAMRGASDGDKHEASRIGAANKAG